MITEKHIFEATVRLCGIFIGVLYILPFVLIAISSFQSALLFIPMPIAGLLMVFGGKRLSVSSILAIAVLLVFSSVFYYQIRFYDKFGIEISLYLRIAFGTSLIVIPVILFEFVRVFFRLREMFFSGLFLAAIGLQLVYLFTLVLPKEWLFGLTCAVVWGVYAAYLVALKLNARIGRNKADKLID